MPRFVRPTLTCGCFQFQIMLKTGIVSSESGESSWRKFCLGQTALGCCALWAVRRQRFRFLVYWLLHLKTLKTTPDLSLYRLCQLWCLALCICHFIVFANCGLWPYVFVSLPSLPTVVFGPMYLSVYHLCQLWCLAFCIRLFKTVVQIQEITMSVTTSVNIWCFFYLML